MSTDHARVLFHRVLALAPDGDPNAYANIHWSYVSKRDGKTYWSGRACKTSDDLIDAVNFANRSSQVKDVYFCLSTQRLAETKEVNGRSFMAPLRSQQNAAQLRALYVDVDVKEGAYADQKQALTALAVFVRDAKMPTPNAIVSSGSGGLHVYWGLDKPLSLQEWQPLANSLAEAARRHKFMCDTACTVDGARILRVPGTMNRKREPSTVVELLFGQVFAPIPVASIREALSDYLPSNVTPMMPLAARTGVHDLSVNDDLSAGVGQAKPVLLSDVVAAGCGFLKEAVETGGASNPYPLWNLTTLIATFTEGGSADAHEMSKGHPQYDPAQTEAHFQQKLQERSRKNLGWPSCASIQNAGCGHCATCPHLALGKSPLNIAGPARQAGVPAGVQDDLPPKYMRDANGVVRMAVTLENGATDWEQVIPDPIFDGYLDLSTEPGTLMFTTVNAKTKQQRVVRVTTDLVNSTSANDMLKRLGAQAFMVPSHRGIALKDFLMAYTKRLQELSGRVLTGRPFGWEWKNGDVVSFSYAGVAHRKDGTTTRALQPARAMAMTYEPHGDLDTWKQAAAAVTDVKRPDLEVLLATAFAAPLLVFTGEDGAIVSSVSTESGKGKSTALKLGLSVWAHPRAYAGNNDTPLSVRDKIVSLRNLPAYWDDVRAEDPAKLIDFVLSVSSGKGKARLNRDGTPRVVDTYETLLTTTSNISLFDLASRHTGGDVAPSYRVFEFHSPVGVKLPTTGGEIANLCSHHYGVAGQVYAAYLGSNGPAINALTRKTLGTLKMRLGYQPAERFWFATVASIIVGADLARSLGLVQFDVPAIVNFLSSKIEVLRKRISTSTTNLSREANADEVLQRYFDFVGPTQTLMTKVVTDPRLRGQPPRQDHLGDRSVISRDSILVHRGVDDGHVTFIKRDFDQWLWKTGYQVDAVLGALEKRWRMVTYRGTLAAGTDYAKLVRVYLYYIDLRSPSDESDD